MKISKVMVVLFVPVATQIIIACCGCDPVQKQHYSHESITVENIDNSGVTPVVMTTTSVPKNAYGLRLDIDREVVAEHREAVGSIFQSAYAVSCDDCAPPFEYNAKDSIVAIKIFSVYDFDAEHLANSDISEYFKIYRSISGYPFTSILDYLTSPDPYGYYGRSNWTLYSQIELESDVTLLLMTPPTLRTLNKFRLEVTLSDGRSFEHETSEIDFI